MEKKRYYVSMRRFIILSSFIIGFVSFFISYKKKEDTSLLAKLEQMMYRTKMNVHWNKCNERVLQHLAQLLKGTPNWEWVPTVRLASGDSRRIFLICITRVYSFTQNQHFKIHRIFLEYRSALEKTLSKRRRTIK